MVSIVGNDYSSHGRGVIRYHCPTGNQLKNWASCEFFNANDQNRHPTEKTRSILANNLELVFDPSSQFSLLKPARI